jgi:hypothetical protein
MPCSNPGSPTQASELVRCEKTQPRYDRTSGRNCRLGQPGPVRKTLHWVAFAFLLPPGGAGSAGPPAVGCRLVRPSVGPVPPWSDAKTVSETPSARFY